MNIIHRRPRSETSLDMTPLIDVVFQLLIFLLVATKFTKPETTVDLPSGPAASENQVQPDRKALSLAITPEGELTCNNEPTSLEALPGAIAAHLAAGNPSRAEIRGDKVSDFGIFVKLLETTRAAGIQSIAIVKQVEDPPPASQ